MSGDSWWKCPLVRRSCLVPPLIFALWLLQDEEGGALKALRHHPPSLRVYRAFGELILVLVCGAVSLRVWEANAHLNRALVGRLLFEPPASESSYHQTSTDCVDNQHEHDVNINMTTPSSKHSDSSPDVEAYKDCLAEQDATTDEDDVQIENENDTSTIDFDEVDPMIMVDLSEGASLSKEPDTLLAPTSREVACMALDLLVLMLLSLFCFTLSSAEGGWFQTMQENKGITHKVGTSFAQSVANVAAPLFPLGLFLVALVASIFPWNTKRKNFWMVLWCTASAPFQPVTFRDGFVGDILTSTVRPLQDVAFTLFYFGSGLQGWWFHSYGIDEANIPVEHSWLLHTGILPACMISPLWWRFLQNLRQAYDTKQRWPYLGNALKYFVAAEVALFGLFDPSKKQTYTWIVCFFLATMYQVWWDVFMDWELFSWHGWPHYSSTKRNKGDLGSRIPLVMRKKRLYQYRAMYYCILVINILLRFCWTLSFIPPRYLNQSGMLLDSFGKTFETFAGPAIASAEIIRRTLWGFLRLELEAIKVTSHEITSHTNDDNSDDANLTSTTTMDNMDAFYRTHTDADGLYDDEDDDHVIELVPMTIAGTENSMYGSSGSSGRFKGIFSSGIFQSDMSHMNDIQILTELCIWATAFTSLGIIAAAHREVM
eukprot:CAMPEP_0198291832 /NCGR_PEP_ID=MMETSP1449-20131203/9218_1 /TAXON_ID=420275 /ORGANISM="Attheya septentrionalis, Strain CCMP2084" /LENGTH=655 /DNA_ID=CAMNT_0043990515 /DNA_START=241 /DNA_END=2208 /DNA_ORIENTATION=-